MLSAERAARVAAGITHIVEVGIRNDGIVFASRQDGPKHTAFSPWYEAMAAEIPGEDGAIGPDARPLLDPTGISSALSAGEVALNSMLTPEVLLATADFRVVRTRYSTIMVIIALAVAGAACAIRRSTGEFRSCAMSSRRRRASAIPRPR